MNGLLHQFTGVADRNRQVRTAKITQRSEVHSNDLATAIEERSPGTAGGCRCIVNNLVGQHIADVSLSGCWPDEVLCCQLRNNLGYLVGVFHHFLSRVASRAGEDAVDS